MTSSQRQVIIIFSRLINLYCLIQDGGTHTVSFTLMALRHGEIPLPKVFVTAFHTREGSTSTPPPTLETYQQHGAEKVHILPRGGKTTFMVNVMREV